MNAESDIREIHALMRLIDDPDSAVFFEISRKIHSYGNSIVPFLESEWERTANPLIQTRIEDLIHQIQFEAVKSDFDQWVRMGSRQLLQACMIVARYRYPELNEADVEVEISQIRKDIWLELNDQLTPLEQIKVFNHIFYDIHGFTGNTRNYHAPENSFLNMALESRKGNPLSIGIIYMVVAQSLDLPVYGINLPEHFVLAYMGSDFTEERGGLPAKKALFYINAFSKGAVFSQQEVVDFLQHLGHDPDPVFFEPCSNEAIVKRMLNNLVNAYTKAGQKERARDMEVLRDIITSPGLP